MEYKTIKDYIKQINELFPTISENDIKKIMNYSWKLLYLLNSYGGDTIVTSPHFWCYIGSLRYNSMLHFNYYCRKLAKRMRILYKRKKIKWDGYYYFGLNDSQIENYLKLKNHKGRPTKNFKFGTVRLYKIKDECRIKQWNCRYIFRIPMLDDFGYTLFKQDFISNKAELIEVREKPKFKDILVTNNNYEVLK